MTIENERRFNRLAELAESISDIVTRWEFPVDTELIGDETYRAAVVAEIQASAERAQELLEKAKTELDTRLLALNVAWRSRK